MSHLNVPIKQGELVTIIDGSYMVDYIEKGYDEKTEFNIDKWIEENL